MSVGFLQFFEVPQKKVKYKTENNLIQTPLKLIF